MMKKLLLIVCVGLLVSCSITQPALNVEPGDVVESFPVKGTQGWMINQKLKFGDYETTRVKRSWTRGGNTRIDVPVGGTPTYPNLISYETSGRHQNYAFQMSDRHGNFSDVYATSNFRSKDLNFGKSDSFFGITLSSENIFYLQLFLNIDAQPWQLMLDNDASQIAAKRYRGVFAQDEKNFYTLEPITKVQGETGPTELIGGSIGYEIVNPKNELVAAVSLVNGGNVYFNTKDPKERFLMAGLCAALLLQEDLTQ